MSRNGNDPDQPDPTGVQPAPGRVEFDSRGNSVWRWAKDVIDSTSILLKRLDNKDLALEPTQKIPVVGGQAGLRQRAGKADTQPGRLDKRPGGKHPGAKRSALELGLADSKPLQGGGGGFDPYNSR
jgi:hypothetical protein